MQNRKRQKSEANMFEMHADQMAGDRNFLNNYDSYTAAQLHQNQNQKRLGQP